MNKYAIEECPSCGLPHFDDEYCVPAEAFMEAVPIAFCACCGQEIFDADDIQSVGPNSVIWHAACAENIYG